MKSFLSLTRKSMFLILCIVVLLAANSSHAAEGLQKLRVAYAAITAAFSIPWIAKEAGLYQRHGLDVELIYIASGPRAIQTLVGGGIDIVAFGGAAAIDARLAGADTVYVAIPVKRLIFFTVVAPQILNCLDLRCDAYRHAH